MVMCSKHRCTHVLSRSKWTCVLAFTPLWKTRRSLVTFWNGTDFFEDVAGLPCRYQRNKHERRDSFIHCGVYKSWSASENAGCSWRWCNYSFSGTILRPLYTPYCIRFSTQLPKLPQYSHSLSHTHTHTHTHTQKSACTCTLEHT